MVPESVKDCLQDVAFLLQRSEKILARGIKIPSAILLYGSPGTGKTQCARTLANEVRAHFIAASTAELKAPFIGQSGQRVKQLFEDARSHAPCIVFLDEIDAVASDRGGHTDSFNQEVLTQLLQEIDGIKDLRKTPVVLIAATNRKNNLDPALLSRFRDLLEVPLPTQHERLKLLNILLETTPATPAAATVLEQWVANGTVATRDTDPIEGNAVARHTTRAESILSHRDIDQLVNRALGLAVRRLRRTEETVHAHELSDQPTASPRNPCVRLRIEIDDALAVVAAQGTDNTRNDRLDPAQVA